MKRYWGTRLAAVFGCVAVLGVTVEVEAKRFGGARSLGVQRQALPPRPTPAKQAAPTNPGSPPATATPAPTTAATATSTTGTATAVAAPKSGPSRWMGPIAGLAAGLGLGALLSHLGLSETFASLLLLALLGFGAFVVLRWFLRSTTAGSRPEYAGASAAAGVTPIRAPGSGASARPKGLAPLEAPTRVEPTFSKPFPVRPEGFDGGAFLAHARANFNALQAAHDSGDLAAIRDVTTPEMYAEIFDDIRARERHRATEVVRLDAEIVEVKTENSAHWASVKFSGLLREDGAELALPFEEVWNLTKPVDGSSGWLLAGIEQL